MRMKCRICENSKENKSYQVREMMFGTRDTFEYVACANCGCVQIKDYPLDVGKYYAPHGKAYYSFQPRHKSSWDKWIERKHFEQGIGKTSIVGALLQWKRGTYQVSDWMRLSETKPESKILDIGSGVGNLLLTLAELGYQNLLGIDPFVDKDIEYPQANIKVLKKSIEELDGEYDTIMLHHVFEHLPNPQAALVHIAKLLPKGGKLIIRIPVAGTYAWRTYQENWVQLDAPRHFYLHTEKSLGLLLQQTGFVIDQVVFDSGTFQFWGSEQFKNNVATNSPDSLNKLSNRLKVIPILRKYKKQAQLLNEAKDGDQACFYIRKL